MSKKMHRLFSTLAATAVACAGLLGSIGCQSQIGGQTLPSPHYMQDDVQYFAPSSEMPLQREAAAIQEYNAQKMSGQ